jgi:hypothetical protein
VFAQIGLGFSGYEAGLMLLPGGAVLAAVLLLAGKLAGKLADRFPSNRVAMAGLAFFALSAILMGLSSTTTGFWMLALWGGDRSHWAGTDHSWAQCRGPAPAALRHRGSGLGVDQFLPPARRRPRRHAAGAVPRRARTPVECRAWIAADAGGDSS